MILYDASISTGQLPSTPYFSLTFVDQQTSQLSCMESIHVGIYSTEIVIEIRPFAKTLKICIFFKYSLLVKFICDHVTHMETSLLI